MRNAMRFTPPPPNCALCPRLVSFREHNQTHYPEFYNGAVPSFGGLDATLLVVGLAPGLKGANRTGRPFTADYAGLILYEGLLKAGFAQGHYDARADDGLVLNGARISNAVRCVPPENLPLPVEIRACNGFLKAELAGMPGLRVVLALGVVAHNALLRAKGIPASRFAFAHGAQHRLPDGLILADSYHVSRYNTSTRRLTPEMFQAAMAGVMAALQGE